MFDRREFIKLVGAGAGAGVVAFASGEGRAKTLAIRLDQVPALEKVGGSAILKLAGKEVLLARVSEQSVAALSPVCTHQKCYVSYAHDKRQLVCGCHQSGFDLAGKVLYGPAPAPLPRFHAELDGERVLVKVDS